MLRVQAVYDQGTADHQEDGFGVHFPFLVIADGLSAPYSPGRPPVLSEGMSGGEMVRETILRMLYSSTRNSSLERIILHANEIVGEIQRNRGIPLDNAGLLAGAAFVFARIGTETIEIIQGGDCLAVWSYDSGRFGATRNQAYPHCSANLKIIATLMQKQNGNRGKMWEDFLPILSDRRQMDMNNQMSVSGFAVLNGQPTITKCWQKLEIPVAGLRLLLLFTDGLLTPYDESANEMSMAQRLIADYQELGLEGMLGKKRLEESKRQLSYTDQEEATAIVVVFQ